MKNLIFFLSLLIVTSVSAQRDILKDSTAFNNTGGVFYEVNVIQYRDGSEITSITPYADTASLISAYVEKFRSKAASMAVDAQGVSRFNSRVKDMILENDQILSLTGRSPLATIQNRAAPEMLDSNWTIKNGGSLPIKFTVNAQGVFRYRIDTMPNKTAVLLGPMMRLNNYPVNGTNTVFYRMPNGRYIDMNNNYTIHITGQSANKAARSMQAPPTQQQRSPILLDDGAVLIGEALYRYDQDEWKQVQKAPTQKPQAKKSTKKKKS